MPLPAPSAPPLVRPVRGCWPSSWPCSPCRRSPPPAPARRPSRPSCWCTARSPTRPAGPASSSAWSGRLSRSSRPPTRCAASAPTRPTSGLPVDDQGPDRARRALLRRDGPDQCGDRQPERQGARLHRRVRARRGRQRPLPLGARHRRPARPGGADDPAVPRPTGPRVRRGTSSSTCSGTSSRATCRASWPAPWRSRSGPRRSSRWANPPVRRRGGRSRRGTWWPARTGRSAPTWSVRWPPASGREDHGGQGRLPRRDDLTAGRDGEVHRARRPVGGVARRLSARARRARTRPRSRRGA